MSEEFSYPPLPAHLAQTSARGATEGSPVAQFEIGPQRNFVYLILDWKTRRAAVVDPQADLAPLFAVLEPHGFRLGAILLTHTHPDHTAGVPELASRIPGLELWVHPDDRGRLHRPERQGLDVRECRDGDEIAVGELRVRILHTPGHSPGECCYFLEGAPPFLWTGDTVFIRDCGRTDLAGGSNEEMFASLTRIRTLPPETVILPGHHYQPECASTLAREARESPPLRARSVEELANLP